MCLLLILLSTVWACRKTDEDRLVEYLKQAYPPEYAEHVKLGVLDSVYDPYDSLCALLNIIDSVKDMPIMDAILHDNRKKANALGRNATIYESGGYTKNIVVIYDANGKEDQKASRRVEVYLYASEAMINAANAGTLQ